MAQEVKSNATYSLEHRNISTRFNWSCHAEAKTKHFLNAPFKTKICSDEFALSFKLNGQDIDISWFLEIYPNGEDTNSPKGDCQIYLKLTNLPVTQTHRVLSLEIDRRLHIEEINFTLAHRDIKYHETNKAWGIGYGTLKLSKFNDYQVLKNGGFSINASIRIKNITVQPLSKQEISHFGNPEKKPSIMKNNSVNDDDSHTLNTIVAQLNRIENEIGKIKHKLDNNNNINNEEKESGKEDLTKNKYLTSFEQWILSIFGNKTEIGQQYIDIIVKKEGFDDIETFSTLKEKDLIEIGIDKKGHRVKFIRKMQQYIKQKAANKLQGGSQLETAFEGY